MNDYFSVSEAAEKLRCSRAAVHQAISRGRLSAQKAGSQLLIKAEDLERYLQETRPDGQPIKGRPKKQSA